MREGCPCSPPPVLLSVGGLLLFLLDAVLDVWAVVSLFQTGQYVYMGLLIALLFCSSSLVQVFSWIWYTDIQEPETYTPTSDFQEPETKQKTKVETSKLDSWQRCMAKKRLIGLLHILHLGMFFRLAVSIRKSVKSKKLEKSSEEEINEYLDKLMLHDVGMLNLFETFTESVPQLVLMITLIMQEQQLQLFTGCKIAGSLASITYCLLSYHTSMRKLISRKQKMGWSSSAVFFLWNLFLITPRVLAVALFASILPCYIAAHFLSWWVLLFLWAWRQKTDFMETERGERLYRATVGLIWYFSWFNVLKGKTRTTNIIYHACMGADIGLLLGLWFWQRSVESARLNPLPVNPYVLIVTLPALYITGLLLKLLYYWKFHPRFKDETSHAEPLTELQAEPQKKIPHKRAAVLNDSDSVSSEESEPANSKTDMSPAALDEQNSEAEQTTKPQRVIADVHNRMKNMAFNF
ncbi:XK-related protein 8-like [Colossoma macropomum]|uniref:XK-related protein 8-like n=1 Tax=Colossoma macropomum TaxID=42526 RepID=UPI0018646E41|nr:XK-related protein 8-like [Colossoma macropomum]XP_036421866.1 XK-related protein 8-like [Colossoma macropomum]XP_036421868.1 XK-related protein 8-like [Colossoma macropomum]XP_036421869.1 XK-related protein 8-like [Colossoma macropomum]